MIFETFTRAGIIAQCIARKEARILDHPLPLSIINFYKDWLIIISSLYLGAGPKSWHHAGCPKPYEGEEQPMPSKVSYLEDS